MTETGNRKADGVSWEFSDLPFKGAMEKDGLKEELEATLTESKESLASLLFQS